MIVLMMLATAPFTLCFTKTAEGGQTCPEPANLSIPSKSSGSISFDWIDCTGGPNGAGCNQYLVKYYRVGDGFQSQVYAVSDSEISFSGLPSGAYDFSFATDCGSATSGWIVIEELIAN